ncbi:diguanylate cyclase domain-containing protein [Thiosulfativibrio zosterae]|nr:diguanylate cyclase [Thiosulfativibrio zosterae]
MSAWAKTDYTIGILAFRPAEVVKATWQPLVDELQEKIPNARFSLVPYNYPDLEKAVNNKSIDFVFTNSANYIFLQHFHPRMTPLVSLINQYQNQPLYGFGGVVVVRADSNIRFLNDLKNKTIVAPNTHSLGGYMMQVFELLKAGVPTNQYQVNTVGMPHDKSIKTLLDGKADAAFVRTGVLEQLFASGALKPNQVRALPNLQEAQFPLKISTEIYPEWPFVAMPHIDEKLASQVASVLLSIPQQGELAKKLGIFGFKIPSDYQPVRQILQALRAEPYNTTPTFTLEDIWFKFHTSILTISALSLVVLVLVGLLFNTYRKLLKSHQKLKENAEELQLTALSFNSYQPILITNDKKEIIKINKAFTETFGYTEKEVIGQNPSIFASREHKPNFYKNIWEQVEINGFWRGEIWDRKKSGELFPVSSTITAIKDPTGKVTHYHASYLDITFDKALEEHYKNLALTDPLTKLANRTLLKDRIEHAIASAKRYKTIYALVFIDLDNFKVLNDNYGHHLGDLLLKEIANRLTHNVRDLDTVARLGGDEFVLLLESLSTSPEEAYEFAAEIVGKVQQAILVPYLLDELSYEASASFGITLFSDQISNETLIMKQADTAMYQAKNAGKNTISFYPYNSNEESFS